MSVNIFASWRIIFRPTCAGVVWGLVWSADLAVVEADEGVRGDVPHSEQSLAPTCTLSIVDQKRFSTIKLSIYNNKILSDFYFLRKIAS